MKKIIALLLFGLLAAPLLHAQTEARVSASELDAERARIVTERAAAEQRGLQERTACYQKFAVQDCLQDSRRRQPILVQDATQLAHRALARVDDNGVGSGVRRQHVAVALQQPGGKSGDQHELQFPTRTIVDGSRHPY